MQPESERVVDCVDMREGCCPNLRSVAKSQVCSLVTVSPTAQIDFFRTPRQGCPKRAGRANSNDQWSSESEDESDLNEFQRKMRREHRQALATVNKACIVVERNRRKRITLSCSRLRQLLPQVSGARGDMVTVLEMTVAFLEHVHQATFGHLLRECLYPPDDLCRRWLSETRQRKKLVQRQGCMEEKTDLPIRVSAPPSACEHAYRAVPHLGATHTPEVLRPLILVLPSTVTCDPGPPTASSHLELLLHSQGVLVVELNDDMDQRGVPEERT